MSFRDLLHMFEERAQRHPEKILYTFLPGSITEPRHLTYGDLDREARELAAKLQRRAKPGDRLLLLFPCDQNYILAFVACIYAGMIPVPLYPPHSPKALEKLQTVAANCGARAFLSTGELKAKILDGLAHLPGLALEGLAIDEMNEAASWQRPAPDRETITFLQYTSGSTGSPKGVILTHGNLMSNFAMMRKAMTGGPDDLIVSWLPMYHDMGLIGAILHTAYTGMRTVLMPPATAIRPFRWLSAIDHYRATVTVAPNFAFDLCLQKISEEQASSLDLSSLRVIFNGAEPVRWSTQRNFQGKFAPARLAPDVFAACYGLAEASLIVTSREMTRPSSRILADREALTQGKIHPAAGDEAQSFVSCGPTFDGLTVKIMSPATSTELSTKEIGEIWISGDNVTRGYWNLEEKSDAFAEHGGRSYFRTGDLGFLDEAGELYVTGRIKDLIIIRGKNYAPQDLELSARESHDILRNFLNAAISIVDGEEEKLVLLQEIRGRFPSDSLRAIADSVTDAIGRDFGLRIHELLFVESSSLDRTSSGKIRRSEIKRKYLAKELQPYAGE